MGGASSRTTQPAPPPTAPACAPPAHLQPPYVAVIFSSQRRAPAAAAASLARHDSDDSDRDDDGYAAAAERMLALARDQPGFLGAESARGGDGLGITVSYWRTERDVAAWRCEAEHAATRDLGRAAWYERYQVRVARVERAYGWDAGGDGAGPPAGAVVGWGGGR
jgi:heme-degrading monooxygenase HmoA